MRRNSTIPWHPRTANLLEQPFGRWTVKAFAGYRESNAYWSCECACGTVKDCAASALQDGTSLSCGCWRGELNSLTKTTHGMTHAPEFTVWQQMLNRCYNSNDKSYPNYGGRGITVTESWRQSFEVFYEDMGQRPSSQHSIDRYPDMNGPYSKENCRWATKQEQARNRRTNKFITHHGVTQTLGEWAQSADLSLQTFRQRLLKGWTMEEALATSARPQYPTGIPSIFTYHGITQSLVAWAKDYNMSSVTLRRRLLRGDSLEKALSRPPAPQKRPKDSY